MALTDINQATVGLGSLQLRETSNKTPLIAKQAIVFGRNTKYSTMSSTSGFLGKQDNQNAAALSPEMGINKLLERTKYSIVQENGQRCYGPPPNWKNEAPPRGCEVFIGKIPRDCYEDELIPIFERIGPIYMFRLMMEITGSNRGYGFCLYTNREDTKRAVQELDNYEIRKGKGIGVCFSVDNCRLFVGGIPKIKTKEEIMLEMKRVTDGVKDVIAYPSINDKSKNRGFAFVEYESHKSAAMARRKLYPGRIQLWGQQIAVDWAEPEKEVNEDIMQKAKISELTRIGYPVSIHSNMANQKLKFKVKILYVRNLMLSTTEDSLREQFIRVLGEDQNCIERVKKISDYAFVHFKEREQAAKCLEALNDTNIEGSRIEVTWAKPADKSDINSRQQTNRTSSRLAGDFLINKELTCNTIAATNGLIQQMDTTGQFILPTVGQHQTLAPELLSINTNAVNAAAGGIGFVNPGARLNGSRLGRRNAAGSRSAGSQRDRKHPVEILEELSRSSGWGTPLYSTAVVELFNSYSPYKVPLYVGQVCFPNVNLQYSSSRGYYTQDEAKAGACEVALNHLSYNQLILETPHQKSQNSILLSGSNGVSLSSTTPTTPTQCSSKKGTHVSEYEKSVLAETFKESTSLQLVSSESNALIYNSSSSGTTQNIECLQPIQYQEMSQPIRLDNNICSDTVDMTQQGSSCRSCTMYQTQSGSLVPVPQVNLPPFTQVIFPTAQPPFTSPQTHHSLTVSSTDQHQNHPNNHHQQYHQYHHQQQHQAAPQSGLMPCFTSVHSQPSYSNLPNQVVQYLASPYPTYRPIQNTQLNSNQSVGIPTCQAVTATMNNHMMSSGTSYLPFALQSVSNSLGLLPSVPSLPQLGTNHTPMASQSTNQLPPVNLASSLQPVADCAAINGFDYYPGPLSAFSNQSAYFFDPLLFGSANNLSGFPSGMLESKSAIANTPNAGNILDLVSNPLPLSSTTPSVVGSASQINHPGIYNLSLPVPTVATQMVQPSNQCVQQPASVVGLYTPLQQVASSGRPIVSVSVSLANTQSVSIKKSSQLSLPIPDHG